MTSLLYPALQKFYSALSSMERFNKEMSFFDNISSLDTFFSEFRSITFVMQKSLAHTEYEDMYKKNCDKYLTDCKWLVEKRNETIKEKPFQLIKQIEITLYFPNQGLNVGKRCFSVDNDVSIDILFDSIREMLRGINPIEVFFSAEYSFYEKDNSTEIYQKMLSGICAMKRFLSVMQTGIGEYSEICQDLTRKIDASAFYTYPRDMLFVNDYVYYPKTDTFERANRVTVGMQGGRKVFTRQPLTLLSDVIFVRLGSNNFQRFVAMHVINQSTDLLPAIMVVYADNTFEMDVYNANIKTTTYRKLNETARCILSENVTEVFFMMTYVSCAFSQENLNATSKERLSLSNDEFLSFMKVDSDLNEEEYVYDDSQLGDMNCLLRQLLKGGNKKLYFGVNNMTPIVEAFKKRKELSEL